MSDLPPSVMGLSVGDGEERSRAPKSPRAFRTISEVAEDLDVPQHVLRFWETRFAQIRPLKRAGGRRYYRPEDVALLRRIRSLLYSQGYTIRGVQKLLREPALRGGGLDPGHVVAEDIADAVPAGHLSGAPVAAICAEPPLLSQKQRMAAPIDTTILELEAIRTDLLRLKSLLR
jgi:DNA-binding transcriptional MerR regulator